MNIRLLTEHHLKLLCLKVCFVRKHSYLEHGYLGGCSRGQNLGRQAYAALKCSNEPQHEISNNVVCATSKASDQPAHTRSLIRAFASRLNIL